MGDDTFIEHRTVDVQIKRLRESLAPVECQTMIETVRGCGISAGPEPGGSFDRLMLPASVTFLSPQARSLAAMHIDLELPTESTALDTVWVRACARRLTLLDKLLDPADAQCIAVEMSQHMHWRAMAPGLAAASVMFEFADVQQR